MRVQSIAHKGQRRLYEKNSSKGLRAETLDKLREILTFLDASPAGIARVLPLWRVQIPTGDRKGTWRLRVPTTGG